MVWQDIYMTCGDDIKGTTGNTSSRHGKVSNVWSKIETSFDETIVFDVFKNGEPKLGEWEATQKIDEWSEKGKPNRIKYWEEKLKKIKKENETRGMSAEIHLKNKREDTKIFINYNLIDMNLQKHANKGVEEAIKYLLKKTDQDKQKLIMKILNDEI